jgi:hypothetical protein
MKPHLHTATSFILAHKLKSGCLQPLNHLRVHLSQTSIGKLTQPWTPYLRTYSIILYWQLFAASYLWACPPATWKLQKRCNAETNQTLNIDHKFENKKALEINFTRFWKLTTDYYKFGRIWNMRINLRHAISCLSLHILAEKHILKNVNEVFWSLRYC